MGELMRRLNQPPVLGELLAGILLGPSLFGALWPEGFQAIFGDRAALESLATVGLILLMLLTGLETDVRLMRGMGRATFTCSLFGMLIPFGTGILLGLMLDDRFVLKSRLALTLFLATAMAVSAMPVIAKILMDLKLIRRNLGLVTLSAAVVDDTVGWIVLGLITGLVKEGSLEVGHVIQVLAWLAIFLAFSAFVMYSLLRRLLPQADHFLHLPSSEMVVIVVTAFLFAAATEQLHIHAVFGAFVAGVIFRQCPTVSREELHRLESVSVSLLAPLFFGLVGLQVDLTKMTGVGLPLAVLGLAWAGKVAGCFLGGVLGRLPRWESLAVGFGMSARGAVGLVVAKLGLDMGIMDVELYSALVLMAVITSLIAPFSLRLIYRRLPPSEEEKLRETGEATGLLPSGPLRILVPASGGSNAVLGCHLGASLCRAEGDRCTAIYVETSPPGWWQRLLRRNRTAVNLKSYFQRMLEAAGAASRYVSPRETAMQGSVMETLLSEARKGCQFLFVGASGHRHPVNDPFIEGLVKGAPCHLAIVSGTPETRNRETLHLFASAPKVPVPLPFQRILVPTNGSYYSDAAFELAARYAENTGASIHVLYVSEGTPVNPLLPGAAQEVGEIGREMLRTTLEQQLTPRFRHPERLFCCVRESESVLTGLLNEMRIGGYDLVVVGAENKSLVERLYLGPNLEAVLEEAPCSVVVVIPKIGGRA
jgi:Kef-type K+ transport system membrane component KefB/nucleotide-binding universal stress UspA family protein